MTDKSPLDDDWEKLANDWQSQPYEHVDVAKLLKKVKRRVWLAKISIWSNVIMTLALIGSFVWGLLFSDWKNHTLIYLGLGSVYAIVFVFYETKIRASHPSAEAVPADKVIEHSMQSCVAAINYVKLNLYATFVLFPLVNWFVINVTEDRNKPMFTPLLVANLLGLSIVLLCVWLLRRRKLELKKLNELQNTL